MDGEIHRTSSKREARKSALKKFLETTTVKGVGKVRAILFENFAHPSHG